MIVWIVYIILIAIFLAIDLGVFNNNPHEISNKEAGLWTTIWVSIAMLFSIAIYFIFKYNWVPNTVEELKPMNAVVKYITGYLIELSLSVDNIFVIAVIFNSFNIPKKYQHRVLFWGIIGAIIFRAIMILFGVFLIKKFDWVIYIFGGFLLFTAIKMVLQKEEAYDPKKSFIYKYLRKIMPVTSVVNSQRFFVKKVGLYMATPLFLTLVVIEFTDILFALDSIPAILAITATPFLVFSSNIMAILGLRSMYFFLANMLERFTYLKYSLVAILSFVGIKMMLIHYIKIPEWVSLSFIAISLLIGTGISLSKEKE